MANQPGKSSSAFRKFFLKKCIFDSWLAGAEVPLRPAHLYRDRILFCLMQAGSLPLWTSLMADHTGPAASHH